MTFAQPFLVDEDTLRTDRIRVKNAFLACQKVGEIQQ